jgi:hypothetical protein
MQTHEKKDLRVLIVGQKLHTKTILEDLFVKNFMSDYNLKIESTDDGECAKIIISELRPQIIITEIMLKTLTGYALADWFIDIRKRLKLNTYFICLSSIGFGENTILLNAKFDASFNLPLENCDKATIIKIISNFMTGKI